MRDPKMGQGPYFNPAIPSRMAGRWDAELSAAMRAVNAGLGGKSGLAAPS